MRLVKHEYIITSKADSLEHKEKYSPSQNPKHLEQSKGLNLCVNQKIFNSSGIRLMHANQKLNAAMYK